MFEGFEIYEIREFGYVLRDDLINKWYEHSFDESTSESEKVKKTGEATKIIESVIGRKSVPSYPLFLLTIIQYLESDTSLNLNYSSHADYYQLLISQDLYKVFEKDELNLYLNYLSELAYNMFIKDKDFISRTDLELFHNTYENNYDLSLGLSNTIDRLKASNIIQEEIEAYKFKYKYSYYFFTSSYISKNLNKENTISIIKKCFNNLHIEKYANIIIFLTYHVNDDFVLDEVIKIAKNLFREYDIIKLEEDVAGINTLIRDVPKLVIEKSKDYKEARRDVLKRKDERDEHQDKDENDDKPELQSIDDIHSLKHSTRLDFASKIIQILGQILRNYYGSLLGEKKNQLVEEAYFLALRCLKSVFDVFERGTDILIYIIEKVLKQENEMPEDKVEEHARRVVFFLIVFFSAAFIQKVTDKIGSDKLLETFNNILEKHPFNAVKLIDISIDLDFNYPIIPIDDIRKLVAEFDKNFVAQTILVTLVRQFIYMYPIEDRRNLQQLADILKVPLKQLIITRAATK